MIKSKIIEYKEYQMFLDVFELLKLMLLISCFVAQSLPPKINFHFLLYHQVAGDVLQEEKLLYTCRSTHAHTHTHL